LEPPAVVVTFFAGGFVGAAMAIAVKRLMLIGQRMLNPNLITPKWVAAFA